MKFATSRLLALSFVLAAAVALGAEPAELDDVLGLVRGLFYQAVESPAAVQEAEAIIEASFPVPQHSRPPVIRAYSAALDGLKGKHVKGLFEKLRHVQKAIPLLRTLPEENPSNPEILFLRFTLFRQLPGFFGVRSTVAPDLERLVALLELRSFDQVPQEIQRYIAGYLLGCSEASAAQRARLEPLAAGA
jgi:hypothetical protein